ncbi:telomerase reverse transcriptase-like [Temnothorax curvispinosus]|uniref:Telomerase reverse transcriptase n=1 Tax=Temnothorax curvispinosus TaxID=300111 RepID=A0A6J1PGA7_9HYME|nr:telomerase reverse transcriptase-like [Temnothorax curvispinosus]
MQEKWKAWRLLLKFLIEMNCNYYKPLFMNNRKYAWHNGRSTSKSAPCPKSEAETKVTSPVPLETYNSKVKLFSSRCRLRKTNRTTAKISKYHILESKNTERDICRSILNTDIGLSSHYKNVNLDNVIPALSPILNVFKIRHNKFNYFDKLKSTAENGQRNGTQKYKNQVDTRLLQSFFSSLLNKNVPPELFGKRNRNAINRTIYRLLKTVPGNMTIKSAFKRTVRRTENATGALLDLQPLFKKLDISDIRWLHSIDNSIVQWIIILKLLHWFFTQYVIKILHKYVVLKEIHNQWVYITKDNWCKMQEEFIREKENTLGLVPDTTLNKTHNIGTYKFIPGSSGLRALFITKYDVKEKYDDIDVVLRFLQQLYVTFSNENGIPSVASCRKEISNFLYPRSKKRLYFVLCDIQDAFGSIIQQKLYDIIVMYCEQLEKYLAVRTFTLLKTKRSQRKKFTVQILSYKLRKHIPKNTKITKEKPKLVQTKKLLNKIKKLIFRQKVKLNERIYSINFGVPQGASVSPILSDIYYQHMSEKIFSEYLNNSLLCRYVDDILYITENEHYAAKFLETIKNGIPEYNVRFNPNKIKSNVGMPYRRTNITFLKQISITL